MINNNLDLGVKTISKLSIFLFIIAGNYVGDIYSCKLRHLFNEHMILKHVLGFFIMLLFVGLIQEEISITQKIGESFFLYTWFIAIMRAPMEITLTVICLITIMYILHMYGEDLKKEDKQVQYEKIVKVNRVLFVISVLLAFVGTILFAISTKIKYGDKFSFFTFINGIRDQECFIELENMPVKIKKRLQKKK